MSRQIKLVTLNTYDLFTDEEFEVYSNIINLRKKMAQEKLSALKEGVKVNDDDMEEIMSEKTEDVRKLEKLIKKHSDTPRRVRLKNVIDTNKLDKIQEIKGVTWDSLRLSRKIAEFESEESRLMGLKNLDVTFDKIILKWKSIDMLEQVVKNGFYMSVYQDDGTIKDIHYSVITASSGQLRTDKVQCLSDEMWNRIKKSIECGMDWDTINKVKGINVNKLLAYTALASSATERWDIDVDRFIVVKDFEAPVTGMMEYIKPDYTSERGIRTVMINHCDGCGMVLPSEYDKNAMLRAPWIKGLLTPFDFIRFCNVNNVEPIIKDAWGLEHNLVEEDIRVILTESQHKLWKYYDSWEHYKRCFKECGCHFCRTNYEEDYIADTTLNYQFIQTLVDFTDDEIKEFTRKTEEKIVNLTSDVNSMLRALNADEDSELSYCRALSIYPELLRDGYARENLKQIKKRMVYDARSGAIKCRNKRLFAIPDMYAACQFWFLGQTEPEGLLKDGEVSSTIFKNREKLDILRSPHLYMEHAIRKVNHNPMVYDWFKSNGIYTSCHDLISRILQFDCDGDQLNCVDEPIIINAAERNIEKYNIIPLFYDANKAAPEILSREIMYNGLKRAHDYSGIGQISNALTKLWNSNKEPDYEAAAMLCMYNNLTIDAAKSGVLNSYESYPDAYKK